MTRMAFILCKYTRQVFVFTNCVMFGNKDICFFLDYSYSYFYDGLVGAVVIRCNVGNK